MPRPKKNDVRGEWKKFFNEEIPDLYFSPSVIRVIK